MRGGEIRIGEAHPAIQLSGSVLKFPCSCLSVALTAVHLKSYGLRAKLTVHLSGFLSSVDQPSNGLEDAGEAVHRPTSHVLALFCFSALQLL